MRKLTVRASIENIRKVIDFVDNQLEAANCPLKVKYQIHIVIDEIFGNIANYAYSGKMGQVIVCVEFMKEGEAVKITFIDNGTPYNPLIKQDPDITLPAGKREIGGLGIYVVKQYMDDVFYEFKKGQNRLSVIKNFKS